MSMPDISGAGSFEQLWSRWEQEQGNHEVLPKGGFHNRTGSSNSASDTPYQDGSPRTGKGKQHIDDIISEYAERGRLRRAREDSVEQREKNKQQDEWLAQYERRWEKLLQFAGKSSTNVGDAFRSEDLSKCSNRDRDSKIGFSDVPWPFMPSGAYTCHYKMEELAAAEVNPASVGLSTAEVLLGVRWLQYKDSKKADQKKLVRRAMRRWHPDKFMQLLGPQLVPDHVERKHSVEAVKGVVQELTALNNTI
jgi:hypothetical protein